MSAKCTDPKCNCRSFTTGGLFAEICKKCHHWNWQHGIKAESPLPPVARNTDLLTSHIAAGQITNRKGIMGDVLREVLAKPGQTPGELGESTGHGYIKVQRRISDLLNIRQVRYGPPRKWESRLQRTVWPV